MTGSLLASDLRFLIKGLGTWFPPLDNYRRRKATTHSSDQARYGYTVWMRHLVLANQFGLNRVPERLLEFGPGDSLGLGVMALLTGCQQYTGVDAVAFNKWESTRRVLDEMVSLLRERTPLPDESEYPRTSPKLDSYAFPTDLLGNEHLDQCISEARVNRIRQELSDDGMGQMLRYHVATEGFADLPQAHFDWVLSQAVMEHVDRVVDVYRMMFSALKPGGLASHVIDLGSHHLSTYWNGHWRYSDWVWALGRGKREFLINRQPLSYHVEQAKKIGFEVVHCARSSPRSGLDRCHLAKRFRDMSDDDFRTSGVVLVFRKPD